MLEHEELHILEVAKFLLKHKTLSWVQRLPVQETAKVIEYAQSIGDAAPSPEGQARQTRSAKPKKKKEPDWGVDYYRFKGALATAIKFIKKNPQELPQEDSPQEVLSQEEGLPVDEEAIGETIGETIEAVADDNNDKISESEASSSLDPLVSQQAQPPLTSPHNLSESTEALANTSDSSPDPLVDQPSTTQTPVTETLEQSLDGESLSRPTTSTLPQNTSSPLNTSTTSPPSKDKAKAKAIDQGKTTNKAQPFPFAVQFWVDVGTSDKTYELQPFPIEAQSTKQSPSLTTSKRPIVRLPTPEPVDKPVVRSPTPEPTTPKPITPKSDFPLPQIPQRPLPAALQQDLSRVAKTSPSLIPVPAKLHPSKLHIKAKSVDFVPHRPTFLTKSLVTQSLSKPSSYVHKEVQTDSVVCDNKEVQTDSVVYVNKEIQTDSVVYVNSLVQTENLTEPTPTEPTICCDKEVQTKLTYSGQTLSVATMSSSQATTSSAQKGKAPQKGKSVSFSTNVQTQKAPLPPANDDDPSDPSDDPSDDDDDNEDDDEEDDDNRHNNNRPNGRDDRNNRDHRRRRNDTGMTAAEMRQVRNIVAGVQAAFQTPQFTAMMQAVTLNNNNQADVAQQRADMDGWKITNIGFFDPDVKISDGSKELTHIGKDLVIRSVDVFCRAVRNAATNDTRRTKIQRHLHELYRGRAQSWWVAVLSEYQRTCYTDDLDLHLVKLNDQFQIPAQEALQNMKQLYTKDECLRDVDIQHWAMEIVRNCRAYGMLDQLQCMGQIYANLDVELQSIVTEPSAAITLEEYLAFLRQRQVMWRRLLLEKGNKDLSKVQADPLRTMPLSGAPQRMAANYQISQTEAGSSTEIDEQANWQRSSYGQGRGRGYRGNRDRRDGGDDRRNYYDDRRGYDSQRGYEGRRNYRGDYRRDDRPRDRDRNNNRRYRGRGPRRFKGNNYQPRRRLWRRWVKKGTRPNGEMYFVEDYKLDPNDDDFEDSEAKLIEDGFEFHEEYYSEVSDSESDSSSYSSRPKSDNSDIAKRTCGKCTKIFDTRSNCIRHVYANTCTPPKKKGWGPWKKGDQVTNQSSPRKKAGIYNGESAFVGHFDVSGDNKSESADTKGDAYYASKPNLPNLSFEDYECVEAKPINNPIDESRRRTSLELTVINRQGKRSTVCGDTGASSCMVDHQWLEDFVDNVEITRQSRPMVAGGIVGSMEMTDKAKFVLYVIAKPRNGKRRVVALTVEAWISKHRLRPNLLLGTDFCLDNGVTINYPKRSLTMESCTGESIPIKITKTKEVLRRKVVAATRTVIPAHSMQVIPVSYLDLPYGKDFEMIASYQGTLHGVVDANTPKGVAYLNNSSEPVIVHDRTRLGTLVEMDTTTCEGFIATTWEKANAAQATSLANDESISNGDFFSANFELSDTVTDVLSSDDVPVEEIWNATDTSVPKIEELRTPSLGAEKPDDLPHIVTKDGVHICNTDQQFAKRIRRLAEESDIWRDRGIIKVPEKEKLRVDLIDNWQDKYKAGGVYPLGIQDRKFLDETFDKMHKEGKMEWMREPTPFGAPCFVFWKTVEGKKKGRVVIDLRALNQCVLPDIYPLPRQEHIIAKLRGSKYCSCVDGSAFFHQLPVAKEHRDRMVVVSPRGLEVSNVVLMGYRNSPANAQRFMDKQLLPFASFAAAYIDDIVIFSKSRAEHERHLRQLFKMFAEVGLALSPKKSFLGYPSIKLLGFIINGEGAAIPEERLEAIRKIRMPTTLADLETYIGLTGFLRKHIPYYQQKVQPLQDRKTKMLAEGRENKEIPSTTSARKKYTSRRRFEPTPMELESFKIMQEDLSQPTILSHWNPDEQTFVNIDAAKQRGFGVMIFHLSRPWDGERIPIDAIKPIMFLSKTLTRAESRYGATELEVAGLCWTCRQTRVQLQSCSKPIVVLTDHSATKGIVNQTSLKSVDLNKMNDKLVVSSNWLSQFNLDIRHVPGVLNLVPDALSRLAALDTKKDTAEKDNKTKSILEDISDEFVYHSTEITIDDDFKKKVMDGYTIDRRLNRMRQILKTAKKDKKDTAKWFRHELTKGLMYHVDDTGRRRLMIPSNCVKEIFDIVHDKKHHFGPKRMIQDLEGVCIQNLSRKIKEYVNFCPECQVNRIDRSKPNGELLPINSTSQPFHTVAWDFIVGLPVVSSKNSPWAVEGFSTFDALMVITCKFSKKTILIPGNTKYKAHHWAELALRAFLLYDWGIPARAISDRDPKFVSEMWQTIFARMQTKLAMSTSYHPQTDGQTERRNQEVELAIRFHCSTSSGPWDAIIPALQHNLNNSKSTPLGRSPNEVVYGFRPRTIISSMEIPCNAIDYDTMRKLYQKEAKAAMDFAAADSKIRYDAKHKPVRFHIGDTVYLRLHKGYSLPGRPPRKWSIQRAGPLTIKKRVGDLAYELDIPLSWRIHKVISVAHLCQVPQGKDPYNRRLPQAGRVIVEGDNDEWVSYEIEKLINRRVNRQGSPTLEYLVRWKSYDPMHDQWYARELLMQNAAQLVDEYDKAHPLTLAELKLKDDEADVRQPPDPVDERDNANRNNQEKVTTPRSLDKERPNNKVTTPSKELIIPKTNIRVEIPKRAATPPKVPQMARAPPLRLPPPRKVKLLPPIPPKP